MEGGRHASRPLRRLGGSAGLRIAIVGSGVSGLGAAWLLARRHQVTLFEAAPRLGGHSHTVEVEVNGRGVAVDTGFIVFNERTYPLLTRMLAELDVPSRPTSMSFSASIGDAALEYAGTSLGAVLAQPRNAVRPAFIRMLTEIPRFNRMGLRFLHEQPHSSLTLRALLDIGRFGRGLREWYLLPMAAAIWSVPIGRTLDFPAATFLRFFANHNLLTIDRHHPWRTVVGGSRRYVERIAATLPPTVRLASPVQAVRRTPRGQVELRLPGGESRFFDHVVLACHADTSLALMADADRAERAILGGVSFQPNRAVLHTDQRLMPRRRKAWAAWNYAAPWERRGDERVSVTYWMNELQSLELAMPLMITLNPVREPAARTVLLESEYHHPVLDAGAIAAQERLPEIQGRDGVWHAGAWTGNGFHEDGLRSGFAVARALGCAPPWEHAAPTPAAARRA